MPYHVFRHLSAITAVRPTPNDVTCAYQAGGREGRVGRRKFYLRVELIKCIDPNEGEALKRGREGEGGEGAGGREGGEGGAEGAEGNFT